MSQQDFNHNLEAAIDSVNQLIWFNKLLEMALTYTNTFSEENFDRIAVLLDSYQAVYHGEIDTLQGSLQELRQQPAKENVRQLPNPWKSTSRKL